MLKRENLYRTEERTPPTLYVADETLIVFPPTPPATLEPDTSKKKVKKKVLFSEEVTVITTLAVELETPRFAIHVLTRDLDTPRDSNSDAERPPQIAEHNPQTETLTLLEEVRELFAKGC